MTVSVPRPGPCGRVIPQELPVPAGHVAVLGHRAPIREIRARCASGMVIALSIGEDIQSSTFGENKMTRFIGTVLVLAFLLTSCSSTTDAPAGVPVTFAARLASVTGLKKPMEPVDSIVLTRIRLVVRHVRFLSPADSSDIRSLPTVVDLGPATGLEDIFISSLPPGNYDGVRIKVHRVEQSDLAGMAPGETAKFDDFLSGDRYSVIAEGIVFDGGISGPRSFVYRSRIDEEQEWFFAEPLVLTESAPVTVTMLLDSGTWFRSSTGALLDPSDPANENAIDDNIRASIEVFEDNDRNGVDD